MLALREVDAIGLDEEGEIGAAMDDQERALVASGDLAERT